MVRLEKTDRCTRSFGVGCFPALPIPQAKSTACAALWPRVSQATMVRPVTSFSKLVIDQAPGIRFCFHYWTESTRNTRFQQPLRSRWPILTFGISIQNASWDSRHVYQEGTSATLLGSGARSCSACPKYRWSLIGQDTLHSNTHVMTEQTATIVQALMAVSWVFARLIIWMFCPDKINRR